MKRGDFLEKSHETGFFEFDDTALYEFSERFCSCFHVDHRVVGSFEPSTEEMLVKLAEFWSLESKASSLQFAVLGRGSHSTE